MEQPSAYLPADRRRAIETGIDLPKRADGAVLFADISGFTPLTDALARKLGARRGAEELTHLLNRVYNALIDQVDRYDGSVIGFSGDAITCWFAAGADLTGAAQRAAACSQAMHQTMHTFKAMQLAPQVSASLAVKTAIASGPVRRIVVGNPSHQLIDVIAGGTLDRMAAAEQVAQEGECLLDETTAILLAEQLSVREWRTSAGVRVAVVGEVRIGATARSLPPSAPHGANMVSPPAIAAFINPAVYTRIQTIEGRFLAELRPATALFVRFSGLDYDDDPDAGEKLDAFIRWVQQVIQRYEGTLIQLTTGDKGSYIYIAFGAPLAHEDDPMRALAAAIELKAVPAHLSSIHSVQIGISQGEMRVGAYGSATRRTYGVLGEETNVAARLMSKAAAGQIVVSQTVADAVSGRYRLLELGAVTLKGRSAPQPIYAAAGGANLGAADRLAHLYTTPLVGRAAEVLAFEQVLVETVRSGHGRLVRVDAEAGLGKSHLLARFVHQAQAHGFNVALAACQSTTQGIAYGAARQIGRALFGLDQGELRSPEEEADLVLAQIQAINPDWLLRAPVLRDLLGAPLADNQVTGAFDPRLRQEVLTSLIVDILLADAVNQPLALLVEDAHWMDETSQAIVVSLARVLAAAPIVLVAVHRPLARGALPILDTLAALPDQLHLHLDELPPEGVAELVLHRLQARVDPLAMAVIQTQAQGNPFFAEELADALADAGRLVYADRSGWELSADIVRRLTAAGCLERTNEAWRLAANAPLASVDLGVPASVHGVVLARLDRLPEPVKLTVKVASVIGRTFDLDLLMRAHPQPSPGTLHEHLDTLLRRDFARVEQPSPRTVYIFKHNIIQEVAYQTMLEDQRRWLHQTVGQAIEESQPASIEQLAFHFSHSDVAQPLLRKQALHYLDAAAERARREYANETALSYLARAIGLEKHPHRLALQVQVLHILGQRDDERAALEQITALGGTTPFEVAMLWGEYHESVGDYDESRAWLQRALDAAEVDGNHTAEARSLSRLGLVAWRQGEYEHAEMVYRQGLAVVTGSEHFVGEEAEIRYGLGLVYRQQGKYADARREFGSSLEINRRLNNRQNEARALNALGHVESIERNFHQAISFYRAALDIRRTIGDRAGVGASTVSVAQALASLGDYSQAEPLLREALAIQQAINNRWDEMLTWNELGILYWLVGQGERAIDHLQTGLACSRAIESETGEAYILCNLGQVLRDANRLAEAEETLRAGLALAVAQGDRNLQAIYHTDLALTLLQAGTHQLAHDEAALARQQFIELGLESSTTPNLATMAAAHLVLNNREEARTCALTCLELLAGEAGETADFPQRDTILCAQVLQQLGEDGLARQSTLRARHLLDAKAARISDTEMRASYLHNVWFNRLIVQMGQVTSDE
jgi:adenylate cyclase